MLSLRTFNFFCLSVLLLLSAASAQTVGLNIMDNQFCYSVEIKT